ncbi:hypothetical protein SCFA_1000008 [anaerobic digester metagenome]|uniref:Uncharacterized protein n=1 Tax=anaerobic digester metagenome TaxID=1263854 RepID=A0A485LTS7_9ZZZZ
MIHSPVTLPRIRAYNGDAERIRTRRLLQKTLNRTLISDLQKFNFSLERPRECNIQASRNYEIETMR